jgi:hypothetical protein
LSVADKDIYRTAKLLIEQHGAGAWIEAAVKHREMVANGDEEGAAVWLRVADAIATLDNMEASSEVH